jgi:hypothetical protein
MLGALAMLLKRIGGTALTAPAGHTPPDARKTYHENGLF